MTFKGRGGGNRRGNFKGKGKSGAEYVYSSSMTLNIMDDGEKVKVGMPDVLADLNEANKTEGESLELAISLTADKADRFIELLQAAQEDPEGDGGIRLQMYLKEGENESTGEVFDSASIMIMGKFPPKNGGRGNRGNFRGKGGGGRRDYDEPKRGRGRAREEEPEEDTEEEETPKRTGGRTTRTEKETTRRKGRQSEPEEGEEEEMEPVKSQYKKGKKSKDADDADVPY